MKEKTPTLLPSPAELSYFIEVAQTQNISRAAERLGIRQPTLSLAIQRLENSFGTPLLIRNKNGVQLTKAGSRLVVQARELLDDWEKLRSEVLEDESQVGGRYTIGAHPSVAIYSLPHVLPHLLRDYPKLEIKLTHDLSRRVAEDVISFNADFGIVINPPSHPDLVIKLLAKDEVSFYVGPGKPSAVTDVESGQAVLICDADLVQSQTLIKGAAKKGLKFARTIHSSSLEVVTALTAGGAGVGVIPYRVASRVKELGLRPVSASAPVFQDQICLIYRVDAQRSKSGKLLAKRIEECLREAFAAE